MSRLTARQFDALTKGLDVPKQGWNKHTFAQRGHLLISAIVHASKIVRLRAAPILARKSQQVFRVQLERIVARAIQLAHVNKSEVIIPVAMSDQRHIWERAIAEALRDSNVQVTTELMPEIQSVMAQGYSRVSIMLGNAPQEQSHAITMEARKIAQKITRINETTRRHLARVIDGSIKEGNTVVDTAKLLMDEMPDFSRNRALTIARTELNQAWTKGSVVAMQQDGMVTHVSVIGCESREEDRWSSPSYQEFMYRGESTCNIENVPITDADLLNFHPNHTGTMVPSRMMDDGSPPPTEPGGANLFSAALALLTGLDLASD